MSERRPGRDQEQRLTLAEAAEVLGLSKDGVRMRVRRGTLRSEKGEDGRVYVFVDATEDATAAYEPQAAVEGSRELVEALRAQVEDLRSRLDREQDANRENRRIIAALTSRIPEIEPPAETRGGDLSPEAEEPSPKSSRRTVQARRQPQSSRSGPGGSGGSGHDTAGPKDLGGGGRRCGTHPPVSVHRYRRRAEQTA